MKTPRGLLVQVTIVLVLIMLLVVSVDKADAIGFTTQSYEEERASFKRLFTFDNQGSLNREIFVPPNADLWKPEFRTLSGVFEATVKVTHTCKGKWPHLNDAPRGTRFNRRL